MKLQKLRFEISETPGTKIKLPVSLAHFVYRYAAWILALIALISIAALPLAKGLKLRANFMDLLPSDTPSIVDLKELNSHVGGASYLIAVIESPAEDISRNAAELFAKEVEAFPGVSSVDNRTSFPAFENRKLLFLTLDGIKKLKLNVQEVIDYNRRKNNPFFIELMDEEAPVIDPESLELEEKVSRIGGFSSKSEGSYMQAVIVKPRHPLSDFETSKILFKELQTTFLKVKAQMDPGASLKMALTGPYKVRYDEYNTIRRDLRLTGVLSAGLIALIMFAGFRSFRSIFYIFAPLGVVMLWTCAFASVAIGYLNLISGFLFGILLGMGIDYAIHLRIALDHHYRESGNMQSAIEKTYAEVGSPIFTSCLTTSIAFYSMAISNFEGFRHFGIIAGTGIILSFIVVYFGVPSLMVAVEKYFPGKKKPYQRLGLKIDFSNRKTGVILTACVLFSVYSLAQVPNMKFDYNFSNLQARDEGILLAERVYKHFAVELTPAAFITPSRKRAVDLAEQLNQYIAAHPGTSFDFTASIMSHVPRDQQEKIRVLGEIDALIERRKALIPSLDPAMREQIESLRSKLKPAPLGAEDLPGGMIRQYEGRAGKISAVFVFPKGGILDGQVAKRFIQELRSLPMAQDIKLAGEPVIYADILMTLERDTPRSLGLSFLMVVLILFIHFKRPVHVFWVLLPVLAAFLWTIGMAGAANFKFNYLNVAILSSVLGAGIDNGIYIYHCFKNRGTRNIFDALRNTGKGVLLASATAVAAFASLLFANHRGMASMGTLGFFGFTACFLTSVIFLPALIQFIEDRRSKRPQARGSLVTVSSSKSSSLYKI